MAVSERRDADLISGSVDDPARFGAVFDRHAATIYRFAWRRVGAVAAEDVTAETFRLAFERRANFDPTRGDVLPWLFGIATNVLHAHRRAERRALRSALVDDVTAAELDDVDSRIDAQAARPVLAKALLALRAGDRDVLLLFAWAGMPYDEIARALDLPMGTVASKLHRARRLVREELRHSGFEIESEG
jgi:RNA polymerase sigma factor (sigma-70 family)